MACRQIFHKTEAEGFASNAFFKLTIQPFQEVYLRRNDSSPIGLTLASGIADILQPLAGGISLEASSGTSNHPRHGIVGQTTFSS